MLGVTPPVSTNIYVCMKGWVGVRECGGVVGCVECVVWREEESRGVGNGDREGEGR